MFCVKSLECGAPFCHKCVQEHTASKFLSLKNPNKLNKQKHSNYCGNCHIK